MKRVNVMKKVIGMAILFCITIPCDVQATRIHDMRNSAGSGTVGGRGPKDFIVVNQTPHTLYTRIAFNVCQAEAFSNFGAGSHYIVRKQGGCIPTVVSGYIWIDGKKVPLVEWRPGGNRTNSAARRHDAAFGAGWVVRMNEDGKTATVYFAGGFSLARPPEGRPSGSNEGRLQRDDVIFGRR